MIHARFTQHLFAFVMTAMLLLVTLAPGNAFPDIVGTGSVINENATTINRDALLEKLGRNDVRAQLERMGVSPDEAVKRVAAMTDAEVAALSAGLGDFPAGGEVGVGVAVLLVILVILILR